MLQISEDAICDAILELEGRACFIDYDEEINDYLFWTSFSDICDELESEQVTLPSSIGHI
jgi:hypothetical protein